MYELAWNGFTFPIFPGNTERRRCHQFLGEAGQLPRNEEFEAVDASADGGKSEIIREAEISSG